MGIDTRTPTGKAKAHLTVLIATPEESCRGISRSSWRLGGCVLVVGHRPVFSPRASTVPSTAATEVTSPVPEGNETGGAIDCRVLC
jgi:hypothetical protein